MKFKIKEWFEKIKEFIKNLTPKQKMYISIGLVLGFILINSMISSDISNWMSALPKRIYQFFIPYGKIKFMDEFLIHHMRKFMHFTEYMVFGILISKYYLFKNKSVNRLINSVYIILSIAFIDETVQIISGRESLVSDMWIDWVGGIVGLLIYFIFRFYKYSKTRKNRRI